MTNIDFPPGWSSERLNTISSDEFSRIPEEVRFSIDDAPLTTRSTLPPLRANYIPRNGQP